MKSIESNDVRSNLLIPGDPREPYAKEVLCLDGDLCGSASCRLGTVVRIARKQFQNCKDGMICDSNIVSGIGCTIQDACSKC